MEFLYKDRDIAVIIKPVGLISEDGGVGESVIPLIKEAAGVSDVYPIHRLDRGVGGVMVYALNKKSAAALSGAVQEGLLKKRYFAILHGKPSEESATLCDLLFKDSKKNKSYVVTRSRKGVKSASLEYVTVKTVDDRTLVDVLLHTGRSHQIRVQFSSRGLPLVGDGRYGAADGERSIALFSREITLPHPKNGEEMTFSAIPCGEVWKDFF